MWYNIYAKQIFNKNNYSRHIFYLSVKIHALFSYAKNNCNENLFGDNSERCIFRASVFGLAHFLFAQKIQQGKYNIKI